MHFCKHLFKNLNILIFSTSVLNVFQESKHYANTFIRIKKHLHNRTVLFLVNTDICLEELLYVFIFYKLI